MLCSGVFGQQVARGYFERALASERISHAYLFVGPEGVGKRRFADELTAALLCRDGRQGACGACASCGLLASGSHAAFLELLPTSGRSIEINTVREAAEKLSLRGWERRVVLIDDAERLTLPATNALLKTLEEPAPGIVFLLVTHRPAHLLDTIHSRCHRVPFTPLTADDFRCVLETHDFDLDLHPHLYDASGGSPGRALRWLTALKECGGADSFAHLMTGKGAERPESLVDFVPVRGKEKSRERVARLLDLVLQGVWGDRTDDPRERQTRAARSLEIAELMRGLEGNQNSGLILEDLGRLLRSQ